MYKLFRVLWWLYTSTMTTTAQLATGYCQYFIENGTTPRLEDTHFMKTSSCSKSIESPEELSKPREMDIIENNCILPCTEDLVGLQDDSSDENEGEDCIDMPNFDNYLQDTSLSKSLTTQAINYDNDDNYYAVPYEESFSSNITTAELKGTSSEFEDDIPTVLLASKDCTEVTGDLRQYEYRTSENLDFTCRVPKEENSFDMGPATRYLQPDSEDDVSCKIRTMVSNQPICTTSQLKKSDAMFGRRCLEDVIDEATFRYNMSHTHRGKAIIINNKTFHKWTKLSERKGSDVDGARMKKLFTNLGFDTSYCVDQDSSSLIHQIQLAVNTFDHKNSDCFALCILSHGNLGTVQMTDGCPLELNEILEPVKQCPGLVGKPKLIIIQACRGGLFDEGNTVPVAEDVDYVDTIDPEPESNIAVNRLPQEADMIVMYSSPPGYYSYRGSKRGSHFITALYKAMEKYAYTKEIMHILAQVNHDVSVNFESNLKKKPGMKICPSVTSQLTKELYFQPK